MPNLNLAIVALNRRNRQFWKEQQVRIEAAMDDEAVLASALSAMDLEGQRHLPVSWRMSFDLAIQHAQANQSLFLKDQARKGGSAKKTDVLQEEIIEIVRRCPRITAAQLLQTFKDRAGIEPIQDIDRKHIYFTRRDGKTAEASTSGLKDRLSRAKKRLNSR